MKELVGKLPLAIVEVKGESGLYAVNRSTIRIKYQSSKGEEIKEEIVEEVFPLRIIRKGIDSLSQKEALSILKEKKIKKIFSSFLSMSLEINNLKAEFFDFTECESLKLAVITDFSGSVIKKVNCGETYKNCLENEFELLLQERIKDGEIFVGKRVAIGKSLFSGSEMIDDQLIFVEINSDSDFLVGTRCVLCEVL